jgi:hypothetical protein
MAEKEKTEINVIMADGSLESIAVSQPRLTAHFLLQQSSLASRVKEDGEAAGEEAAATYMIGQMFLFAAELRRPNGDKIFEDFEDAGNLLHHTSAVTVMGMINENEDMKEILAQSGGNQKAAPEGEPDDPK